MASIPECDFIQKSLFISLKGTHFSRLRHNPALKSSQNPGFGQEWAPAGVNTPN